jgi:hypothetical protein
MYGAPQMAAPRVLVQTRIDRDTAKLLSARARAESRSIADYLRLLIIAHVRPVTNGDVK